MLLWHVASTHFSRVRWSPQLPRYQGCNVGKAWNYFLRCWCRSVRLGLAIIKQGLFYYALLYRKALWLNGYVIAGCPLWVYAVSLLSAIAKYMRIICGYLATQVFFLDIFCLRQSSTYVPFKSGESSDYSFDPKPTHQTIKGRSAEPICGWAPFFSHQASPIVLFSYKIWSYGDLRNEFAGLFSQFGTVVHCVILATVDNSSRRRGFVVMSTHEDAKQVMGALTRTQIKWVMGRCLWMLTQISIGDIP